MTPLAKKRRKKKNPETLDLKFNIRARLLNHTEVKRGEILTLVARHTKKSKTTIKRLIYRRESDPAQNDYEILKAFAKIWRIPVEELECPKIKS